MRLLISLLGTCALLMGQTPDRVDKAVFAPRKDAKLDGIRAKTRAKAEPAPKNRIWLDFAALDAPASNAEFKSIWHQPATCQGLSGMCWSFSTTSFLESEIFRQHGKKLHLSPIHAVYWEYVEKARGYVQSRGTTTLGEGSQGAAVLRAWRKHGVVPMEAYDGLPGTVKEYDTEGTLFVELRKYLEGVKAAGAWDEAQVIATVRALLDHHLGAPPETVLVDGKKLTPKQYLEQVARLNPDDYIEFLSFNDRPYWKQAEYDVPDNWWHGKHYWNLPLDVFLDTFKASLRKGFSLSIAADMSEPGYSISEPGLAVVPSWDIPSSAIDANARQYRFEVGNTQDDHGLHVVGHTTKKGKDWFLVKDSWSSAWNNAHPSYYYYHEDYVKLKVLGFMVHKDAVKEMLPNLKQP